MKATPIKRPPFSVFFVWAIVVGCASARKAIELLEDPGRPASAEAPLAYREGLARLASGDAAGALASFERFSLDQPASPWSQVAAYNSGRALEAMEKWSEAGLRYRAVAQTTEGKAPRLQALALYRLSFCFDATGDDSAALAALRDVAARKAYLPPEIAEAEFPARVAGAYARSGNLEAAAEHFAQAERGIGRIRARMATENRRSTAPSSTPEWLPRTLFEMGRASIKRPSWENAEVSLRAFRMGQKYLLEAAETGAPPWAARAAFAATSAYGDFLAALDELPAPPPSEDPVLERRRQQERRWDLAARILGVLAELKAHRAPAEPGAEASRESLRILSFLEGAERNLRQVLSERAAGSGLTPESSARQNQIRGRMKATSDALEREYSKAPKALPRKRGSSGRVAEPPASSPGPSEDPNL